MEEGHRPGAGAGCLAGGTGVPLATPPVPSSVAAEKLSATKGHRRLSGQGSRGSLEFVRPDGSRVAGDLSAPSLVDGSSRELARPRPWLARGRQGLFALAMTSCRFEMKRCVV